MSTVDFLKIGNKKAVLVGINQYVDSSINKLNHSMKDVKSFHEILIDSNRGQYNPEDVRLLIDNAGEREKPNRSNIMSSITSLSRSANAEDSILFYFSGHGIEEEGTSYLLPLDSRVNVLKDTAIPIGWIKKTLMESNARAKIIILDACHAGALIGKAESGRMTKGFYESIFPAPEGFAVLSSCKMNEVSYVWPEKEHSVFSYFLIKGLQGAADKDKDNVITVTEASNYVTEKVKAWAFRNSREQSPTLECQISGDIFFVSVVAEQVIPETIPVDKSIMRQIVLSSVAGTYPSCVRDGEYLCGELLKFFEPDELVQEDSDIKFPSGLIKKQREEVDRYRLEIIFDYKKENWVSVDSVIAHLDDLYDVGWNSLAYVFGSKFNMNLLVKLCKQRGFGIRSFRPSPDWRLLVTTSGWGSSNSQIVFQNTDKGSWLQISPWLSSSLDRKFYEIIKPENILDFVKNCFH